MNPAKLSNLILLVGIGLMGCAPALQTTPIPRVESTATLAASAVDTLAAKPTLLPHATPSIATKPNPTLSPAVTFAEPAGCLSVAEQAGKSADEMLAYADQLLQLAKPLSSRRMARAWNAGMQTTLVTGSEVMAFSVADVQEGYVIQAMMNALHVAGFVTWLRDDRQGGGLQILAIPLVAGKPSVNWQAYIDAYWKDSASMPHGDATIKPVMKLAPCQWMVTVGAAPDVQPGILEQTNWAQPDFAAAGQGYLAATTAEAFQVAYRINWLENGNVESPVLMCGPLTWSILNDAGAFPPGYGGWLSGPKSFWLPKPSVNGRPWSLFPPESYTVTRFSQALGSYDFNLFPLQTGDVLYTYTAGNGFEHVFVVTDAQDGSTYSVTNIIKNKPKKDYSIRRVQLYDLSDPTAGIMRNEWTNDRINGRTGDKGFEVFRWNWREKDIKGQAAAYYVQPGDSLPLVAARWKTPPERIAAANALDGNSPLKVGQVLVIPPN